MFLAPGAILLFLESFLKAEAKRHWLLCLLMVTFLLIFMIEIGLYKILNRWFWLWHGGKRQNVEVMDVERWWERSIGKFLTYIREEISYVLKKNWLLGQAEKPVWLFFNLVVFIKKLSWLKDNLDWYSERKGNY